jgi:hypothetical protein
MNEREQEALGRHLILSLMTAVLMTGLLIFVLKLFYTPVSAHAGQCKSSGECKAGEECVEGLCERLYCSVGEPCTMSCDCPEPNTCAGEPGKERCTPPPPPAPTCTEPQTAELIRQLRAVHADCLKKTGGKDAASCEPKDLEHFYRAHRDAERLFKESKSGVLVVFMFPTGKPEERDRQKPWVKEALPAYIEQVRALGLVTTLREASSVVMLARATPSKDQNADAKYASSRLWFAMEALGGALDSSLNDAGILAKIMQFPVGSSQLLEAKDLGDYTRVRWVVAPEDKKKLERALKGSTDKTWLKDALNRSVFFFGLSCALPEAEALPEREG